jgi:hypothetical protein
MVNSVPKSSASTVTCRESTGQHCQLWQVTETVVAATRAEIMRNQVVLLSLGCNLLPVHGALS